jgi:hypothetical protein
MDLLQTMKPLNIKIERKSRMAKTFKAIFNLEWKRFFNRRNIFIFLSFSLFSLYFVQEGIHDFKSLADSKLKFQEIEKVKVGQYTHYRQYGSYGFRLLAFPSPLSIFFANSGAFTEMASHLDSGEILQIYHSYTGKNLFLERRGDFKDFSGIILLLGSILALYFGYNSFRYRDYLKYLSDCSNLKSIVFSIIIARAFILIFFFLFLAVAGVALLWINGLALFGPDYLHLLRYVIVMLLMLLFFFISGTVSGCIKSTIIGVITITVLWFVSLFLLPGIISQLVFKRAENITLNYQLELKKLKTLMSYEQEYKRNFGTIPLGEKMPEAATEAVEGYLKNEFSEINRLEKGMIEEMNDNVRFYHRLASLFPSTFYQSVHNEVSSRGYKNFIDFYHYVHDLKGRFVRFFVDKTYYSGNWGKVESFIQGDENIFHARSRLPYYFSLGLILTILYILSLFFLSYLLYRRSIFGMIKLNGSNIKKKFSDITEFKIKLKRGKSYTLLSSEDTSSKLVYLLYSNALPKKDLNSVKEKYSVLVDGGDTLERCTPIGKTASWPPDIKVKDFAVCIQRLTAADRHEVKDHFKNSGLERIWNKSFGSIKESEKRMAIFTAARMKESKFYIIDDLARGMPPGFIIEFRKIIKQMNGEGISILYLSDDIYLAPEVGDHIGFIKKEKPFKELKAATMKKENYSELYFKYLAEK